MTNAAQRLAVSSTSTALCQPVSRRGIKECMPSWKEAIWFVGAAVWLLVAALAVHARSRGHALGAIIVAVVFFAAGLFFNRFGIPSGRR